MRTFFGILSAVLLMFFLLDNASRSRADHFNSKEKPYTVVKVLSRGTFNLFVKDDTGKNFFCECSFDEIPKPGDRVLFVWKPWNFVPKAVIL